MSEWWETNGKKETRHRGSDRLRGIVITQDEGVDGNGAVLRDATPVGAPAPPPVQSDNGQRHDCGTGAYEPTEHCPGCGASLGTALEVQAFQILKTVGAKFAEEQEGDRVTAFEHFAKAIAENLPILVMSRVMSLTESAKAISSIHSMIGAPQKKTESAEENSLKALASWLNGEEVEGFPVMPELPVTEGTEDGAS